MWFLFYFIAVNWFKSEKCFFGQVDSVTSTSVDLNTSLYIFDNCDYSYSHN